MKKLLIAAGAAALMIPSAAIADPNPDSNGVNKNCFGQGRSAFSSNPANPSTGSIIRERARNESASGDYPNQNVEANKVFTETCRAAPAPTPDP